MSHSTAAKLEALVGFGDGWMGRSMETVFQEKGYRVTRTGSGEEALRLARHGNFDVIMLDERIHQLSGMEVCVALRNDPLFDHSTPIVLVAGAQSSPPRRTAAYSVGCWEYCHQPVDMDGLFLKLTTFLRARSELAEHKTRYLALTCPSCASGHTQSQTSFDFETSRDLRSVEGTRPLAYGNGVTSPLAQARS